VKRLKGSHRRGNLLEQFEEGLKHRSFETRTNEARPCMLGLSRKILLSFLHFFGNCGIALHCEKADSTLFSDDVHMQISAIQENIRKGVLLLRSVAGYSKSSVDCFRRPRSICERAELSEAADGWLAVWAARTCNTAGCFRQRDLMFRLCHSRCHSFSSAPVTAQTVDESDCILCFMRTMKRSTAATYPTACVCLYCTLNPSFLQ
jgi:hypothetical protein